MSKNTALMQFIEHFTNLNKWAEKEGIKKDLDKGINSGIKMCLEKATELLTKEREDIENAYNRVTIDELCNIERSSQQYYETTFNQ